MDARSSTYFKSASESAWSNFVVTLPDALNRVDAEMSAKGALKSGAHIKRAEKALVEQFQNYADMLIEKLTRFEAEHSPVKLGDFRFAADEMKRAKEQCEVLFLRSIETKYSHYPKPRKIFAEGDLQRALADKISDLEGRQAEFTSSTSFWKWAWGDMRKRVWAAGLLVVGAALSRLLTWLFSLT